MSAQTRQLRLPDPPRNRGRSGPDLGFYAAYGRAYDMASTLSRQPSRKLREVNPWLSASQCREYLRRARGLGLVTTPARLTGVQQARQAEQQQVAGTGPDGLVTTVPDREADLLDLVDDLQWINWTRTGRLVTLAELHTHVPGRWSDAELRKLMDRAVADGYVQAGHLRDSIRFPSN